MSSHLRGSSTYVWSTASVLGKGATGAVYQGIHKITGETVAVKTFNHLSHMRPYEVQMREFEVLKKVNHDNIVRLLDIEEEQESRTQVLVMELCTGGSLFNILDEPENSFGLQESEFLLVLKHVSAGMKHLRDNNIVHRDLKPGNIMKFMTEDGRSIYKLTDFGAARELPDDQQFMSLYGTEEYLHPDMYERAVLRKSAGKTFGATVDLWSIGVTLYHVATGSLPFRPYGGRKNKETMYHITTGKESGVISGVQTADNGPIKWSRSLPDTCQLSKGLQKLVIILLAGLLESDPMKIWSFDRFFETVTDILLHKIIHVFSVTQGRLLHIYIKPDVPVAELKCFIMEQTDLEPDNQVLIWDNDYIQSSSVPNYPTTCPDSPVFLFSSAVSQIDLLQEKPIQDFPTFSNGVALDNDASVAKTYCSSAFCLKRSVESCVQCNKLMICAVHSLINLIQKNVKEAVDVSRTSLSTLNSDRCWMKLLISCSRFCAAIIEATASTTEDSSEILSKKIQDLVTDKEASNKMVAEQLNALVNRINPLQEKIITEKFLVNSWTSSTESVKDLTRCPLSAASLVQKMKESWQRLYRDKNARALTYNDEQFHLLEKTKMKESSQKLLNLFNNECLPTIEKVALALSKWLQQAYIYQEEVKVILKEAVPAFRDMSQTHKESLDKATLEFENLLQKLELKLKDNMSKLKVGKNNKEIEEDYNIVCNKLKNYQLLKEKFRELRSLQLEVKDETNQNKNLIAQFQSLLTSQQELPAGYMTPPYSYHDQK